MISLSDSNLVFIAGQSPNTNDSHGAFVQGSGQHSSILHRLLLAFADPLWLTHQLTPL